MSKPAGAATPSPGRAQLDAELDRFVGLCDDVLVRLEAGGVMGPAKQQPVHRFVEAAGPGRYPGASIMDAVAVLDSGISAWVGRWTLTAEQHRRTGVLFRQNLQRIGYLGAGTLSTADRLRAERLEAAMLAVVERFAVRSAGGT